MEDEKLIPFYVGQNVTVREGTRSYNSRLVRHGVAYTIDQIDDPFVDGFPIHIDAVYQSYDVDAINHCYVPLESIILIDPSEEDMLRYSLWRMKR